MTSAPKRAQLAHWRPLRREWRHKRFQQQIVTLDSM
jgi:hypothetical protein